MSGLPYSLLHSNPKASSHKVVPATSTNTTKPMKKHHETTHKSTHHKNEVKRAWNKITQQATQAIDGKNNPDAVFYPVHQTRKFVEKTGGDEVKKALIATILFLIISNPQVYRLLNNLLSHISVEVISATGEITSQGVIASGLLFFLVYYLIIKNIPDLI